MCKHVQLKGNVYYYRRRIPEDARELHKVPGSPPPVQLFFSLKTGDKAEASRRADAQTRRLDALWKASREGYPAKGDSHVALATIEAAGFEPGDAERYPNNPAVDVFLDRLVGLREPHEPAIVPTSQQRLVIDLLHGVPVPRFLSDAKEKHFELRKGPRGPVAEKQFDRAWNILLSITGDVPLDQIKREHANEFVRRLIAQGVGSETIKRYLAQVRPVIRTGIQEFELNRPNPFDDLNIPNRGEGKRNPRTTFSIDEIAAIQSAARSMDDERRWLIAMLSDSMARLAEIVGLTKEDVKLEAEVPHILIRPNQFRDLKTAQSERVVPLVGEALWAAIRAVDTKGDALFPSVLPKGRGDDFSAGGVSAALNKWLKDRRLAGEGQVVHSFRHTMRDRLRNVETPAEVIDRIGGWALKSVGEGYGKGHRLPLLQSYMQKAVIVPAGVA
jgi:integrase